MIEPKADLLYAATSFGKTCAIGEVAEYIAEAYGLRTRVVTSDGGSVEVLRSYIKSGIIEEPWVIGPDEPHPVECWQFATQGYWKDPLAKKYTKTGLDRIGFIAFEGLTSFGDAVMRWLKANKVRLSQDPAYVYKDGNTEFAGGNMSYFGEIQTQVYNNVMHSHMIPVKLVWWTALETRGEDDKIPVYGPSIAGKKSISKAPQWFRRTIHGEKVTTEAGKDAHGQLKLDVKRVIYLKDHADPLTRIVFPANPRLPNRIVASFPDSVEYKPGAFKELYQRFAEAPNGDDERLAKLAAKTLSAGAAAIVTQ